MTTTTIYTHCNTDLDSAASVWAAKRFIPGYENSAIEFVPANWRGLDGVDHANVSHNQLALDIAVGIKGGRGGCAFAEIIRTWAPLTEAREVLAPLVEYVTAQDTTGCAEEALFGEENKAMAAFGLNTVLNSLRRSFANNDRQIVNYMSEIFDGWFSGAIERKRAIAAARDCREVSEGSGLLHTVVVQAPVPPATNSILFDSGVGAIVFIDGRNLGVVRSNKETFHVGDMVKDSGIVPEEELEHWFFHNDGFLAAHGTRKAPAEVFSSVPPWLLASAVDKRIHAHVVDQVLDRR